MISLIIIGPNILFTYGLAIGACAAIIALYIISISINRAAETGNKKSVTFGFVIRILLYGGALFLAVRTSDISFAGAAIGLLVPHVALYIMYGLLPAARRKLGKEPPTVYVTDTSSMVFVKEPFFVSYNKSRAYLTHRHYRKKRVVLEEQKAPAGDKKK